MSPVGLHRRSSCSDPFGPVARDGHAATVDKALPTRLVLAERASRLAVPDKGEIGPDCGSPHPGLSVSFLVRQACS